MSATESARIFEKAKGYFPGGVNSPVRAFKAVGGQPLFITRGEGPYLYDVDGNRYIDYVLSWGPLVLGHAYPDVVVALQEAAADGSSYGAPCPRELELAGLVQAFMPNIEMMRFVNSGTEATMSALRLARAFTGRDKIVKFEGCYHGHADMLLVQAGSGVATLGLPDSPGVPQATTQNTLTAAYNNLDEVQQLFEDYPEKIAAVIIEPVAGNMGVVPPKDGFLQGLRDLCSQHEALLIFDEVMTGFRVHPGGAQTLYDIQPDLTTLGKVIGGGLPVGAYGGRREIMEMIAPSGPVYQAGTLSGNPLAMAAGAATLRQLQKPGTWEQAQNAASALVVGMGEISANAGVPIQSNQVGTMFSFFFTSDPVEDWSTVKNTDKDKFIDFFGKMLSQGIYLAPSPFEAGFTSVAHNETVIAETLEAIENAL